MADIDFEDLTQPTPQDNWTVEERNMFQHLEILTPRIVSNGKDITSNLGKDWTTVYMCYGRLGESARDMYHKVCQLAKDYHFDVCEDKFKWAVENSKYKTLKKLIQILRYYEIDTTFNDERVDSVDEIAAYLPEGVDPIFVLTNGFYPYIQGAKTGYYFRTGDKTFSAQSNFVIKPIMHLKSKTDNKRVIRIDNGFRKATLELPSRNLISVDLFSSTVYEAGNFMFMGSKVHLIKILQAINEDFQDTWELKTLGWQPEGFFAYSNSIYKPGYPHVEPFDESGIADVAGVNFFSPSASDIYSGQRMDDDEYQNDRYLTYRKPEVNFAEWASMFNNVYPDQSMMGIAFVIIAIFKDIVFKVDNNCPMLSAYGKKGSGKSKFAESVSAVFNHNLLPFNLNHGTDFAFFNRLARFRNCVAWLDEFDDQELKSDRFQSIKGAYDGAGRERGRGTSKNKTEVAHVNSALLLTGQYLSTRDDNAALSRCIILAFTPAEGRSEAEIRSYDTLKELEKKGLGGLLIELLAHREEFNENYIKTFADTFSSLRSAISKSKDAYEERVLRNYTSALTCLRFFSKKMPFPFSYEECFSYCQGQVVKLSKLMAQSDSLADFWNTLVYLIDIGEISEGLHYRVIHTEEITISGASGDEKKRLNGIQKILLLRLTTVHKLYLEAHRKQYGKTGINLQSLELYLTSAKYWMGRSKSQRFTTEQGSSTVTSCHVFDLAELDIPVEREPVESDLPKTDLSGTLLGTVEATIVKGKAAIKFVLISASTVITGDKTYRNEEKTYMTSFDPTHAEILENRKEVIVTGVLKEFSQRTGDKDFTTKRTMDVLSIKYARDFEPDPPPLAPDAPF